ncbi:NUDIX hydrolase domain-like protein [Phlyctochytrium arcticum]|nr:NUDIX hydrolase domain-like protein [Phlyctochytrium arcticum]
MLRAEGAADPRPVPGLEPSLLTVFGAPTSSSKPNPVNHPQATRTANVTVDHDNPYATFSTISANKGLVSLTAKKITTLVFLFEEGTDGRKVLLGMKKRGFGAGYYNGFGGKVEAGETIEQAARRELEEEAGVVVEQLEPIGTLFFRFGSVTTGLEVHVFSAQTYTGSISETEEMRPEWFPASQIPFHQMWPDDEHWWPYVNQGKLFGAAFWFHEDHKTILHSSIKTFSALPSGVNFDGHWIDGVLDS